MNTQSRQSPKITHISWGRMEIDGLGNGRDFKLYPGGGRGWDWKETNTHHAPGIQPGDVEELLANGSSVVILSRGMQLALQTTPETIELLKRRRRAFPHRGDQRRRHALQPLSRGGSAGRRPLPFDMLIQHR